MNAKKLPSIFGYADFRKFLDDYQKARYEFDKGYSKASLCMRMGLLNSRSFFNDVLKGKKVTSDFIERFLGVLDLDHDESQYFRVLVKYNQAENSHERELYFRQLLSLNKIQKKIVDLKTYEFYREWYHVAIRTLLDTFDFSDNYAELSKILIPQITVAKVKESIKLLDSLGLISKNEHGFYKPTDKALTTAGFVKDELIRQYQLQCIKLAGNALFSNDENPKEIYTNTISVSHACLKQLQEELNKFKAIVCTLVNKDENHADQVYQLNVQFFANSRKEDKK